MSLFAQQALDSKKVTNLTFEELLNFVTCDYGTQRRGLSEIFWPAYDNIKLHRDTIRTSKTEQSIEVKALHNLKVALKIINVSDEETIDFIKTLIKDIKNYFTFSKYALRRLAFEKLNPKSSKQKWEQFFEELNHLKFKYGVDYLDKILEKVKDQNEEIIIAVENQNGSK